MLHGHQGAVVLGEVDLRVGDPLVRQGAGKALGEPLCHLVEGGVEDGGVFTLDEAHGADLAGYGDMDVLAHHLPAEGGDLLFVVASDGGERAGDGDGLAPPLHAGEERPRRAHVQGSQLLAVELKAAPDDDGLLDDLLDVGRPVHHRRDTRGGGGSDAHQADLGQVLPLHDGVGALGSAQHGLGDLPAVDAGGLQHIVDGAQNAIVHVARGGVLDVGDHLQLVVDDDGVRVRAAYVDAQLIHAPRLLSQAPPGEHSPHRCQNTGGRPAPGPPACATCGSTSSPPPGPVCRISAPQW